MTDPVTAVDGVTTSPDGRGGILLKRGVQQIGHAFPVMAYQPGGPWFGKPTGRPARRFNNRDQAVAHVTGDADE